MRAYIRMYVRMYVCVCVCVCVCVSVCVYIYPGTWSPLGRTVARTSSSDRVLGKGLITVTVTMSKLSALIHRLYVISEPVPWKRGKKEKPVKKKVTVLKRESVVCWYSIQ